MLLLPQDCGSRCDNHKVMDPSLQPHVGLSPALQGGQDFALAGEQARELSSAEHPDGPGSSRVCEGEAAGFLLLHSSRLKPSLCIQALESCRFSSLLVLEELQRGSCDSLFQLCFYWKLENIIVILPIFQQRACAAHSKRTPRKPPRAGGRREGGLRRTSTT